MNSVAGIYWVAGALVGLGAFMLIWKQGGCRHPNPHYIRQGTQLNDVTGEVVVRPAQYCCYECGKTWPAEQRDPAWSATGLVQKFEGYDEKKARRGAKRMASEERQRRALAARRVQPVEPAPTPIQFAAPSAPRRPQPTEVVSLRSRKPA
ncbi:MAG TPA: hypothetical protein VLT86_13565 [Vicinamibacterales bacterium]|nr:hypothetical protein [Vicinamibacterales bacterium]